MNVFTKMDFNRMDLLKLETEKNRMFKKILQGKEVRKNRNILYELLGVLESRKKLEGTPIEIELA